MNAPRTGAQLRGSADPFWWGLAALLSLGSIWLPKMLNLEGNRLTELMAVGCGLFFSGALVGCVRRDRPWRWAIACFATFALRDLVVVLGSTAPGHLHVAELVILVIGHLGVYFLYALPVLAGALLGASMMGAGLE